jgi:hypothetical protein
MRRVRWVCLPLIVGTFWAGVAVLTVTAVRVAT